MSDETGIEMTDSSAYGAVHDEDDLASVSSVLDQLAAHVQDRSHLTLGEMSDFLGSRSFALLLILLAAPAGLPVPAPWGVTQILAVLMVIISAQLALGLHTLWLPGWLARRRLKRGFIQVLAEKGGPIFRRIERLIAPRLLFMERWAMQRLTGLWCMVCSLSVVIPLPLTNTIPSAGVVLMGMAMLERDGLLTIGGMLIGLMGLCITLAVLFLGHEAVRAFL